MSTQCCINLSLLPNCQWLFLGVPMCSGSQGNVWLETQAIIRDLKVKAKEAASLDAASRAAYNISANSATQTLCLPAMEGQNPAASTSRTVAQLDHKSFMTNERVDPKTQICFDFTKGVCARGSSCKYSHDLELIVQVNSQERGVCFDFLRGQCQRGQLCRFSHDISNITAQQGQVRNNPFLTRQYMTQNFSGKTSITG